MHCSVRSGGSENVCASREGLRARMSHKALFNAAIETDFRDPRMSSLSRPHVSASTDACHSVSVGARGVGVDKCGRQFGHCMGEGVLGFVCDAVGTGKGGGWVDVEFSLGV
jgi:hypothetical protein